MIFKAPKTAKSRRTIDIPKEVIQELEALREEQVEQRYLLKDKYEDYDLIFCQTNGRPLHGHNVTRRDFKNVLKRAKLPLIRFHDLRHCHATLLLEQGEHPKVVQERLGHAGIGITMDLYSHVVPGMQKAAVERLQARLFDRPKSGR